MLTGCVEILVNYTKEEMQFLKDFVFLIKLFALERFEGK